MLPCLVIARHPLFPTSPSSQRHLCAHPKACGSLPSVGCQLSAVRSRTSPFPVTLARRVNPNPFVCHSCRKHPGWGAVAFFKPNPPRTPDSAPNPLAAHHSPLATIPFTMRTFAKPASNPCRMRSFKTQHLKSSRMCTSEKPPPGGHSQCQFRGGTDGIYPDRIGSLCSFEAAYLGEVNRENPAPAKKRRGSARH